VNTKATQEALARSYFDLFPNGWYVSLYGNRLHYEHRWSWRRLRKVLKIVIEDGERVELTRRWRVPIILEGDTITPKVRTIHFDAAPPGVYDRIGLHADYSSPLIDLSGIPRVQLTGPGSIDAPLGKCSM
jgi:hypothetical protein